MPESSKKSILGIIELEILTVQSRARVSEEVRPTEISPGICVPSIIVSDMRLSRPLFVCIQVCTKGTRFKLKVHLCRLFHKKNYKPCIEIWSETSSLIHAWLLKVVFGICRTFWYSFNDCKWIWTMQLNNMYIYIYVKLLSTSFLSFVLQRLSEVFPDMRGMWIRK